MKRILVTGATGAMGTPLIRLLSKNTEYEVYATSRSPHNEEKINWLIGNAHDSQFFTEILEKHNFDAIVDFMNYPTRAFEERYRFILDHTSHYIFTSSARVYARSDEPIVESSPRILDVCNDELYLSKDSYDLAKAREENFLVNSDYNNWTIIRPSLTYNSKRLQYTLFELDEWLYRFFDNNSIILPEDMKDIVTTMTHGDDVAEAVTRLVLNPDARREIFNVTGGMYDSWGNILKFYKNGLEISTHKRVKVKEVKGAAEVAKHLNRYDQYRLARGINRIVSNDKLRSIAGEIEFVPIQQGLSQCIQAYVQTPNTYYISFRMGAYLDRMVGEITPLNRFDSTKHKVGYLMGRFGLIQV